MGNTTKEQKLERMFNTVNPWEWVSIDDLAYIGNLNHSCVGKYLKRKFGLNLLSKKSESHPKRMFKLKERE